MFARYRGLSGARSAKLCIPQFHLDADHGACHEPRRCVRQLHHDRKLFFGYPGVGTLIQNAILQSDYNMILGCITISIVAISTATLIVDLVYPFIDPRIRYG